MSEKKIDTELINQHGRIERFEIRNDPGVCVLELVEEAGLSSPYGCRVGSCGTCVVEVLSGQEHLLPRTQIEEDTLSRVAPNVASTRLLCRATLKENLPAASKLCFRKIKIV